MAGLRRCGAGERAGGLWSVLAPRLAATNDINAAFLRAAREGAVSAPVLDLFDGLATNDAALPARLATLDSIGHSSGWDSFAGFVAAASALAERAAPGRPHAVSS